MRGKALQKAAVDLARLRGWRVAHFTAVTDSRGFHRTPVAADGKGFPDLLLVRDKVLAIEVKGDGDRIRPEQEEWLEAFREAGVQTMILTPRLYREGILDKVLA